MRIFSSYVRFVQILFFLYSYEYYAENKETESTRGEQIRGQKLRRGCRDGLKLPVAGAEITRATRHRAG